VGRTLRKASYYIQMENTSPAFDADAVRNESYARRIDKPWGWELHWTPENLPYMGKIIHINAGSRLSLQVHDEKLESWIVIKGRAKVAWENNEGTLIETELQPGAGYSCALGQRHRLIGITDCDVVEVSTPELGTTWRLQDDYARPHETMEQRVKERS
jgi:mannose-6-phosphate isomerase